MGKIEEVAILHHSLALTNSLRVMYEPCSLINFSINYVQDKVKRALAAVMQIIKKRAWGSSQRDTSDIHRNVTLPQISALASKQDPTHMHKLLTLVYSLSGWANKITDIDRYFRLISHPSRSVVSLTLSYLFRPTMLRDRWFRRNSMNLSRLHRRSQSETCSKHLKIVYLRIC